MKVAALPALALLTGCACEPYKTAASWGTIEEIAYLEAHDVHHAKTGTDRIPDTWYLKVCDDVRCEDVTIIHPPWKWQYEGSEIKVYWFTCRPNGDWFLESIEAKP